MDLLKLVDIIHIKACFLGKHTKWRQPALSWALSQGIQLPEGINSTIQNSLEQNNNSTQSGTSTQWVYDITSIQTYTYEQSPRNSVAIKCMHKQCVPGALSPTPPLGLGTRLGYKVPGVQNW